MQAMSENAPYQQSLAAPSIVTHPADQTVLTAGRLLILNEDAVTVRERVGIAKFTGPSPMLRGHLVGWLTQPQTPDAHTPDQSKLPVVSTAALLKQNPVALPYAATVVHGRKDRADHPQVELKQKVQDRQLSSITRETIDNTEALGGSGGNLVYGGYPYDPFALDTLEQ